MSLCSGNLQIDIDRKKIQTYSNVKVYAYNSKAFKIVPTMACLNSVTFYSVQRAYDNIVRGESTHGIVIELRKDELGKPMGGPGVINGLLYSVNVPSSGIPSLNSRSDMIIGFGYTFPVVNVPYWIVVYSDDFNLLLIGSGDDYNRIEFSQSDLGFFETADFAGKWSVSAYPIALKTIGSDGASPTPTVTPPPTPSSSPVIYSDCLDKISKGGNKGKSPALIQGSWFDIPDSAYSLLQSTIDCNTQPYGKAIVKIYKNNRKDFVDSYLRSLPAGDEWATFDTKQLCLHLYDIRCGSSAFDTTAAWEYVSNLRPIVPSPTILIDGVNSKTVAQGDSVMLTGFGFAPVSTVTWAVVINNVVTEIGSSVSDSKGTSFFYYQVSLSRGTFQLKAWDGVNLVSSNLLSLTVAPKSGFNIKVTNIAPEGIYVYCYTRESYFNVKTPCVFGSCPITFVKKMFISPPVPVEKYIVFSADDGLVVGQDYAFVAVDKISLVPEIPIPLEPYWLPEDSFFTMTSDLQKLDLLGYGQPMLWESAICSILDIESNRCADTVRSFGREFIYPADSISRVRNHKNLDGSPQDPDEWDYLWTGLSFFPGVIGSVKTVGKSAIKMSSEFTTLSYKLRNVPGAKELFRQYLMPRALSDYLNEDTYYKILTALDDKNLVELEDIFKNYNRNPLDETLRPGVQTELKKVFSSSQTDDVVSKSTHWGPFHDKWVSYNDEFKKTYIRCIIHNDIPITDSIAADLINDIATYPEEAYEYFGWYKDPTVKKFYEPDPNDSVIISKARKLISNIYDLHIPHSKKLSKEFGPQPLNPPYCIDPGISCDPKYTEIEMQYIDLIRSLAKAHLNIIDEPVEAHEPIDSVISMGVDFEGIYEVQYEEAFEELQKNVRAVEDAAVGDIPSVVSAMVREFLTKWDPDFGALKKIDVDHNGASIADRIRLQQKLSTKNTGGADATINMMASAMKVSQWSINKSNDLIEFVKGVGIIDKAWVDDVIHIAQRTGGEDNVRNILRQFRIDNGDYQSMLNALQMSSNIDHQILGKFFDAINVWDMYKLSSSDFLQFADYVAKDAEAVRNAADLAQAARDAERITRDGKAAKDYSDLVTALTRYFDEVDDLLIQNNSYSIKEIAYYTNLLKNLKSVDWRRGTYDHWSKLIAAWVRRLNKKWLTSNPTSVYDVDSPGYYKSRSGWTWWKILSLIFGLITGAQIVVWSIKEMYFDSVSFNLWKVTSYKPLDVGSARIQLRQYKKNIDTMSPLLRVAAVPTIFVTTIDLYIENQKRTYDMYADILKDPDSKYYKTDFALPPSFTSTIGLVEDGNRFNISAHKPNLPEGTATLGTYTYLDYTYDHVDSTNFSDASDKLLNNKVTDINSFLYGDLGLIVRIAGIFSPKDSKFHLDCDNNDHPYMVRRLAVHGNPCDPKNVTSWITDDSTYRNSKNWLSNNLIFGTLASLKSNTSISQYDDEGNFVATVYVNSIDIAPLSLNNGYSAVFFDKAYLDSATESSYLSNESSAKTYTKGIWAFSSDVGSINCKSSDVATIYLDKKEGVWQNTGFKTNKILTNIPVGPHSLKFETQIGSSMKSCTVDVVVIKDAEVPASCSIAVITAQFSYDPKNPNDTQIITFNPSDSYAGDGARITSYQWYDNTVKFSESEKPFVRLLNGTHTIKLTIINNLSDTASVSQVIQVSHLGTEPPSPTPTLTPKPSSTPFPQSKSKQASDQQSVIDTYYYNIKSAAVALSWESFCSLLSTMIKLTNNLDAFVLSNKTELTNEGTYQLYVDTVQADRDSISLFKTQYSCDAQNYVFSESEKTFKAQVTSVMDGDTIEIEYLFNKFTVRLLGINAPEGKDGGYMVRRIGCYPGCTEETWVGDKALYDTVNSFLTGKLWHQIVTVKIDVNKQRDKYHRILGVIVLDNIDINKLMLEKGYAVTYFLDDNVQVNADQRKAYVDAESIAESNNLGVWLSKLSADIGYINIYPISNSKGTTLDNGTIYIDSINTGLKTDNINPVKLPFCDLGACLGRRGAYGSRVITVKLAGYQDWFETHEILKGQIINLYPVMYGLGELPPTPIPTITPSPTPSTPPTSTPTTFSVILSSAPVGATIVVDSKLVSYARIGPLNITPEPIVAEVRDLQHQRITDTKVKASSGKFKGNMIERMLNYLQENNPKDTSGCGCNKVKGAKK